MSHYALTLKLLYFYQALHGFLIVVSQDFNIFYVTETVQDYLGFPQASFTRTFK